MTNKILIDGWNVAWKIEETRKYIPNDLPKARTILNTRIKSYFSGKKTQVKIIFDGKPGVTSEDNYVRGIDVQFSRIPENADRLIIKFLMRQKNTRQWTLITSDRTLGAHASSLGAAVLPSDVFLEKIKSAEPEIPLQAKHNPRLNEEEMKYWLDRFSENKEEDPQ